MEIHFSAVKPPDGPGFVGIEIQPPLDAVAASGLIRSITPRDGKIPDGTTARHAEITRTDENGTALVIDIGSNMPWYSYAPEKVARVIGGLIDPCNIHDIQYVPHTPPAGQL
jgi:hypothetical protein